MLFQHKKEDDVFSKLSLRISQKTFFKIPVFTIYGPMQLDELIPNITLVLLQNDAVLAKIGIWGQKSRFLEDS